MTITKAQTQRIVDAITETLGDQAFVLLVLENNKDTGMAVHTIGNHVEPSNLPMLYRVLAGIVPPAMPETPEPNTTQNNEPNPPITPN